MSTYNFTIYDAPTMPWRLKNLTGQRFHQLLVIGLAGIAGRHSMWHCLCDCGNGTTVSYGNLTTQNTQSCGCLAQKQKFSRLKHGEAVGGKVSPEYRAYHNAKRRCTDTSHEHYAAYGGRGIQFRFESVKELLSEIGRKPDVAYSIERINNDGHYEKGNVRWATQQEQSRNRRTSCLLTLNGRTQSMAAWAAEAHISSSTMSQRRKRGWCDECTVLRGSYEHCFHRD